MQSITLQNESMENDREGNLAVVAIRGEKSTALVKKLLEDKRTVLQLSEQTAGCDEKMLKLTANTCGALYLGAGCEAAYISGLPLGRMPAVKRGNVGVIAASGESFAEFATVLELAKGGISSAIPCGRNDFFYKDDGCAKRAAQLLGEDNETRTIAVIPESFDFAVLSDVLTQAVKTQKPVVCYAHGAGERKLKELNVAYARSLSQAALLCCRERAPECETPDLTYVAAQVKATGLYIRGLFTSGCTAEGFLRELVKSIDGVMSNSPVKPLDRLENFEQSVGHTVLDFSKLPMEKGAEPFMRDTRERDERLIREAADEATAVVALDCSAGLSPDAKEARTLATAVRNSRKGNATFREQLYIVALSGCERDPTPRKIAKQVLEREGIVVVASSSAAASTALGYIERLERFRRYRRKESGWLREFSAIR